MSDCRCDTCEHYYKYDPEYDYCHMCVMMVHDCYKPMSQKCEQKDGAGMICKWDEAFTFADMRETGMCKDCKLDCENQGTVPIMSEYKNENIVRNKIAAKMRGLDECVCKGNMITLRTNSGNGRVAMLEEDGAVYIVFGAANDKSFQHDPGHVFNSHSDTWERSFAFEVDDPESLRHICNYLNECCGRLKSGDAFPFVVGMCY